MLDDFRRTMGDEGFFLASRDFFQTYKDQKTGTAEFRAFWHSQMQGGLCRGSGEFLAPIVVRSSLQPKA
jgi:hypothetical protein